MEPDGEKLKGRFLKLNSQIYGLVEVKEFSFAEICKTTLAYPDNPNNNVLHSRLHEPVELQKLVQPPASFLESLIEPGYRMPVIMPRDFTADWIEEKNKAKRRSAFDEEEFDEELIREKKDKEKKDKEAADAVAFAAEDAAFEKAEAEARKPSQGASHATSGDALKDLQSPQKDLNPMEIVNSAANVQSTSGIKNEGASSSPQSLEPVQEKQKPESHESAKRDHAADSEAAFKEGYERGRNEALAQKDNHLSGLLANTEKIAQEILNLKPEILKNSQGNFIELARALCESLIDREIKFHPETFVSLIRKAIAQTVSDDEFTIKVSPDFYERLPEETAPDLKAKMKSDESISEGSFRIETKLGAVNSGIKKIVDQLIEQADLSLFEENDKSKSDPE